MTLSLALCTYNGARFLKPQLDSIAQQTRPPDEMVICDDGSTDETPQILQAFAASAPFPVHIYPNPARLGITKNYEKAISLCSGDIIALADQDDVWKSQKLARLHDVLNSNPAIGAVFSNAELVDGAGGSLHKTVWESIRFSHQEQTSINSGDALPMLLKHRVVTGATMAFRASFRDRILPIPDSWLHDAWIVLIIALFTELHAIPEPLILYRQHERNRVGAAATFTESIQEAQTRGRESYHQNAQQYADLRERIASWDDVPDKARVLALLDEKITHIQRRANLPDSRPARIMPVIRELARGHYHRYSMGWGSAIKDVFLKG